MTNFVCLKWIQRTYVLKINAVILDLSNVNFKMNVYVWVYICIFAKLKYKTIINYLNISLSFFWFCTCVFIHPS